MAVSSAKPAKTYVVNVLKEDKQIQALMMIIDGVEVVFNKHQLTSIETTLLVAMNKHVLKMRDEKKLDKVLRFTAAVGNIVMLTRDIVVLDKSKYPEFNEYEIAMLSLFHGFVRPPSLAFLCLLGPKLGEWADVIDSMASSCVCVCVCVCVCYLSSFVDVLIDVAPYQAGEDHRRDQTRGHVPEEDEGWMHSMWQARVRSIRMPQLWWWCMHRVCGTS